LCEAQASISVPSTEKCSLDSSGFTSRWFRSFAEHRIPGFLRYCISACIMVVCAVLEMALQMQSGSPGHFVLLPGVFLSGLIFDRGSGIFAAAIAIGVVAYMSYAGATGLDYLAPNAL
jgi:two-component system, sensor histidine kinase PdtaS